jgi:hypothetical protein
MFIRNCWYVVAWDHEVPADGLFARTDRVDQGDASIAKIIYDALVVAFNEDRDMITAQARNIALDPHTPMVPLAMDSALVQFRRLVTQAIEAECASADERLPGDLEPGARSRPDSAGNVRAPAAT